MLYPEYVAKLIQKPLKAQRKELLVLAQSNYNDIIPRLRAQIIHKRIGEMIAVDSQPFSIVEDP